MSLFLFKRFITLVVTLAGASVVIFLVLEILPGNAAQILMGPDAAPEAVTALAQKLGIDRPAPERYGPVQSPWGNPFSSGVCWITPSNEMCSMILRVLIVASVGGCG